MSKLTSLQLQAACTYLEDDRKAHMAAHGKWALDPGKLAAAIDHATEPTAHFEQQPDGTITPVDPVDIGPTAEQLEALRWFARRVGRYWKRQLALRWYRGTDDAIQQPYGALLRQVRNQLGPEWLANFRFKD